MSEEILAAIATLSADIMERLDRLRDDLTVLGGANDAIRRTNENTRDEVRDLARNLGDM